MKDYVNLREQYPRFLYKGYETEEDSQSLKITYQFEIPGLSSFAPAWIFPKRQGDERRWCEDRQVREMIFSLGMVELVSYWKIACPPVVQVECGYLGKEQIAWWKDLYFNGLGEFFYVNKIEEASPEDFMEIRCENGSGKDSGKGAGNGKNSLEPAGSSAMPLSAAAVVPSADDVLVPIGGGKDSVVTLELLRRAGKKITGYIINPRGATIHTAEKAALDGEHVICAKRTLDPNMLELNRQGYLNGHTPFSALVAFSSILAARLWGLSMIALSNESSANESTVQGSTVNHQYSKSFKFEQDFHWYQTHYLEGSAGYFSLLRPLSEFQIARYFAGQKKYHSVFRSCNAGSKTDSWCGHCPKCLFVYLILSPFLSQKELEEIFGRNMLSDVDMKETLDQLIGIQEEKPFECVGSRDEINTAICLTIDHLARQGEHLPALLSYYKTTDLYHQYRDREETYFSYFDEENLVPEDLAQVVREACAQGA